MQQRESTSISDNVTMYLVDDEGSRGAVNVELGYQPSDPFAMSFTFLTAAPVVWTFARDLIGTGIYEPTGEGDVHVWPCLSSNGSAVVIVELSSPEGSIMLECELRPMANFLRRTHELVAPGTEANHLDLDAALADFFSVS